MKNKLDEEALSVSTLSNEDFRKRQPSQLKAKYRQAIGQRGASPSNKQSSGYKSPDKSKMSSQKQGLASKIRGASGKSLGGSNSRRQINPINVD